MKSLITNAIALILLLIGYFANLSIIFNIGIFAFSGAITNWLAIYMLFEKVPFLYGSGVIPRRFEDFKEGIKKLFLEEFFTTKNISNFLSNNTNTDKIKEKIDFDKIFNELLDAIIASPLGGMLGLIGGRDALLPLKEPITEKLKTTLDHILADLSSAESSPLQEKIEAIVDSRLTELTPKIVKTIIQNMIKKHLGWLVVWGGVFGGLLGGIFSLMNF